MSGESQEITRERKDSLHFIFEYSARNTHPPHYLFHYPSLTTSILTAKDGTVSVLAQV